MNIECISDEVLDVSGDLVMKILQLLAMLNYLKKSLMN